MFDTIVVALLISEPSKNSASLRILLSCNSKGLIFAFYLIEREISDGWGVQLPAYKHIMVEQRINSEV